MLNGRFVGGTRHLTKSLRNYSGRTGLPQELAVPRLAVYFSFAADPDTHIMLTIARKYIAS